MVGRVRRDWDEPGYLDGTEKDGFGIWGKNESKHYSDPEGLEYGGN